MDQEADEMVKCTGRHVARLVDKRSNQSASLRWFVSEH